MQFSIEIDSDDGGIETLFVERQQQTLMIERQIARLGVTAVQNCRYFSRCTKAAARTLPLRFTELGIELERSFHNKTPTVVKKRIVPRPSSMHFQGDYISGRA